MYPGLTRENLHCVQSEIDQFIHDLDRRRYANKFGLGDYDLSDAEFQFLKAVSYTHLTLPTIYSV